MYFSNNMMCFGIGRKSECLDTVLQYEVNYCVLSPAPTIIEWNEDKLIPNVIKGRWTLTDMQ